MQHRFLGNHVLVAVLKQRINKYLRSFLELKNITMHKYLKILVQDILCLEVREVDINNFKACAKCSSKFKIG